MMCATSERMSSRRLRNAGTSRCTTMMRASSLRGTDRAAPCRADCGWSPRSRARRPGRHAVGPDRLDLTVLEEAEQQGLHPQAHLADLVEEHRAAMRQLEQSHLVAVRAGEAAANVPNSSDSSSVSEMPRS